MVDKDLILRKIADLDVYLGQLREYAGITADAYAADWKTQRIIERTLQMALESCADIGEHLLSDLALRAPESYADIFRVLGDAGLLEPDAVAALEKMARFRNILVHGYDRVDAGIVVRILRENLGDFDRLKRAALKVIGG
jgi:uncharacterized protein YutE (UPF0331/DUF86 family)